MKKIILLFFSFYLFIFIFSNLHAQCSTPTSNIDCNYESRFTCPIFFGKTSVLKDVVYAKFPINKQWGKLPIAPDYCFPARYRSYKPDTLNEVNYNIFMDIYSPKSISDNCLARPVIIYQHGGGLNPYSEDSRANITSKVICKYFAERGFVVVNMSYRMGWNAGKSGFVPENDTLFRRCYENFLNSNKGEEFSIMEGYYRNIQDFRACHRMILNWNDTSTYLKIDPNKIFYFGISTGGINAINTVFASKELANTKNPRTGLTLKNDFSFGGIDDFGGSKSYKNDIKVAGIITLAGGIVNLDEIDFGNAEKVPLLLFQGDLDSIVPYDYGNLLYDTTLYNGLTVPKYLGIYGSHSIYNKITNDPEVEDLPNVQLYSYKCLGHEIGFRDFYDENRNIQNCLSISSIFMKKIIDNQPIENKHFCILNNYALETSETVDASLEGENFDCLPGIYIDLGDTIINSSDTLYQITDSLITFDSTFISGIGWVYDTITNYIFDTIVLKDTIITPTDTMNILYTPRQITSTNPNIASFLNFNIFPNPISTNYLNIDINQKIDIKSITIYDILGKQFLEIDDIPQKSNFIKLDISNIPKGIFLVNIRTENQMITRKFIRN